MLVGKKVTNFENPMQNKYIRTFRTKYESHESDKNLLQRLQNDIQPQYHQLV
jgi:hypothetical protein